MNPIAAESAPATTAEHDRSRRLLVPVAAATFLVTSFFNLARADSAAEGFGMVAFDLLAIGLVFGLVVARGLRAEGVGVGGVVLGVVGLLFLVPAFWSGLPLVLGAAAALLGHDGRHAASGSGRAAAALVLGTLSVIGYFAVYVGDWIASPGASWWS